MKKHPGLKNAQLVDRATKLCIGTPDIVTGIPAMMDCMDADPTQRWDLSGVYDEYGPLEKAYLSNSRSEFAGTPGRRIILASKSNGEPEFITISQLNYDIYH